MKFVLQSLVLLLCLLFGRGAQAQAPGYTMTYETVTDTPADHFEDYWRRANDALLTESGRTRLQRGQVRLSLRAMSNPARYGLIDPTAATNVMTAARLLCENRETGALQLRCRMPGEPHSRRVYLTERQCRGVPDLYTLVPEGCERPYVMTVEGREVRLSRITRVADPQPPPGEPVPVAEPQQVVAANPLTEARIARLSEALTMERGAALEHRREARSLVTKLDRAYVGIVLLTLVVAVAGIIAWRARDKTKTTRLYLDRMIEQDRELRIYAAKLMGPTDGSGAFRLGPVVAHDMGDKVAMLGMSFVALHDSYVSASKERDRLAAENQLLRKRLDEHPPSVVVDPREAAIAHEAEVIEARLRAEFEARSNAELQRLRAAQDVERDRLQDQIEKLRVELRDAIARRSAKSEPPQSPAAPSEPDALHEVPLVDVITHVIQDAVAQDRRRGPVAAATSGRKTRLGIGEPPREPSSIKTLPPPAPADELSSPPAPTGSPPPPSPSPGDGHRHADIDPWDPAPPSPSEAQAAAHPQLDHRDTSERRPAIVPTGRVWIPLIDGDSITIEEEQDTLH
jgi:hypothetical protein